MNGVYYMNMKISPDDVSNHQILLELRELRKFNEGMSLRMDSVDSRFDSLDSRMGALDSQMGALDSRVSSVEVSNQEILETMNTFASSVDSRFINLEKEQTRMRSVMVTKDYLDDKLAKFHSEIILHTRREIERALS